MANLNGKPVPSWSRDDNRPGAVENAVQKMTADIAATRLNSRGTGSLPLDHERARFQLSEEQRHNRGTRPRTRRWKALTKIDEEVDQLTQKQVEASARAQDAEQAFADAPRADAQTLADWISRGERGERPAASLPERERELAAARLLGEAVVVEIDRALERRLQFVEKNREKMLADAQRAIDDARKQLLAKVSELPELRQALLDARETMLWASHFPDPPESFGFPTAAALGMRKPIEKALGTTARVEYTSLLAALDADADTLASTFSRDQQKRGLGEPAAKTPLVEALWDTDPENVEWKKAELERAKRIGEYSSDLGKVADDARDFRP